MRDITYDDRDGLSPNFPDGYVAWLDDQVLLITGTYDEMCDRLAGMPVDQSRVVIGYVEPAGVVCV